MGKVSVRVAKGCTAARALAVVAVLAQRSTQHALRKATGGADPS